MAFTFGHPDDKLFKDRLRLAYLVALAFLLLLAGRLYYLQIFMGTHYAKESENNSVRMKEILASRGMIRDRHGKTIIDNKPHYIASIVPEDVQDLDAVAKFVANTVSMPTEKIVEKVKRAPRRKSYLPVQIKRGLSWEEVTILETQKFRHPGLEIEVDARRSFIYGDVAPHLLGYLSEINNDELNTLNQERQSDRYRQGDQVGKNGIEKRYETVLKGKDGYKTVRVDSAGREIAELGRVNPEPGRNINLTFDLELELYARELFKDKVGTLLALDPRSGEILAAVNGPSYDPELFSGGISTKDWTRLRDDPDHPLINRAIRGLYPPGSTYKVIPAIAALETGTVSPKTKIKCNGYFRYGNRTFRCWKQGGHGWVDAIDALKHSCDVYYYTMGEKLGITKLAEFAKALGLGRKTGIDVDGEKSGIVPTEEWKKKRFGQPWWPGETISVVIGQGYNLATPLQLATVYGALGNGGKVYRPHLLRTVTDAQGRLIKDVKPEVIDEIEISQSTAKVVKTALEKVVNEPGGTAYWSRLPFHDIKMAGKTGTAQVVNYKAGERSGAKEDHAWFVGFAPVDNPEIVAVALVEHGGHGSSAAAPLVSKLITRHFELKAEREGKRLRLRGEPPLTTISHTGN